jgi:hypothetical protein
MALKQGPRDSHKESKEGKGKRDAAVRILSNLMNRGGKPIIHFYDHVSEMYYELANLKISQPEVKNGRRAPTIVK